MKILFLSDDFPPQGFGGGGISTFYLASGLHKSGHEIFVITTVRKKSDEGTIDYCGLKVFRIFSNYNLKWRSYLSLYNPQSVGKIGKIIKEINPDIVHANNVQPYLSYHCLKIVKSLGPPLFWTARDVMSFNYEKLATQRYLEKFDHRTTWLDHLKQAKKRYNPFRNFFIKKYLRYADRKFAVSHALKDALKQNGINNIEVSYTGIDVDDWQISSEFVEGFKKKYGLLGKKVIFFGGRISPSKGVRQINRAMAEIKKEIPEVVLLVAGTDGLGWLSSNELKLAYAAADIVVVPSVCFDSFPRSNLEAMACKKPVIATCYGGSQEIVQDGVTGFVINPFNIELMAEKIIDLLKDREKARQFGEAGYERVKKYFSLDAHVCQTIAWYQRALKNNQ